MDYRSEITYLLELRDLADALDAYASRIEAAAAAWLAAQTELRRPEWDGGSTTDRWMERLAESGLHQGTIWHNLESFVAAWTRASLMLFPSPRGSAEAKRRSRSRGEHLQKILGIDATHPLADRGFRDFWTHYDEKLDAALVQGQQVVPQRFAEDAPVAGERIMRLIDLRALALVLDGEAFDLRTLFAAARDLQSRVAGALKTMAHRHAAELQRGSGGRSVSKEAPETPNAGEM